MINYSYPQQQIQQQYTMQPNVGNYKNQAQYSWVAPLPQVRPVSSIEEVRAAQIDFDGSVFYFPDIANKKIYTKSVNMDGTVAINLYELKDINMNNTNDQSIDFSNYVTRQEFEEIINQFKEILNNKQTELSQTTAHQQKPTFHF